ncbi:uncharacterized protein LOC143300785 [Babylonia areolata]|uniref:uncharacterized protein LOC143300785 n=1 Tax=Babylonia areolata TaxID=304850 RepID=UPI003FD2CA9E
MATGGEDVDRPLSEEEETTLEKIFTALGSRPKTDSKEALRQWMANVVASQPWLSADMPSAESVKTSNQQQGHHEFADSEPPVAQHLAQPVISVVGRKPWLTKFGGEEGYDLWRHQLLSLHRENHSSQDIADAIRASLQGKAGSLLVSLGPDATVDEILTKLDSIYGQVDEDADVLAAFYSARQGQSETVADWSCRIEGLFSRVRRLSDINGGTDEALRQMFWTGLRQELKDASAYQFDTIKSFDELRKAIRRVEKHPLAPVKTEKTVCNVTQSQPRKDHSESLEAMVKQLSSELKALKQEIKSVHSKKPADTQHSERKDHYQLSGQNRQMSSNNQASDNPAWCQGRHNSWQGGRIRDNRQRGEVVCYRCGEPEDAYTSTGEDAANAIAEDAQPGHRTPMPSTGEDAADAQAPLYAHCQSVGEGWSH